MAGGNRRGRSNSSGKGNNKHRNHRKGSASFGKADLFVDGGFLSDWQLHSTSSPSNRNPGKNASSNKKSGSKSGNVDRPEATVSRSRCGISSGSAIRYIYPSIDLQEVSCTGNNSEDIDLNHLQALDLTDCKHNNVVAHIDQTPPSKPNDVEYTYTYGAEFVLGDCSHRGLGFSEGQDETPSDIGATTERAEPQSTSVLDSLTPEKDIHSSEDINCELSNHMTEGSPSKVPSVRNSGFLSIGGLKLYTEDISDNESDEDSNAESRDECPKYYDSEELDKSTNSSSSEDISDSDSDIDDEVAEDYLEGVGGSDHIIDAKWLLEPALDVSDDGSSSSSCYDEAVEKLGGLALQQASVEYGMKKSHPWKKCSADYRSQGSSIISFGKKHVARFPHSWPSQVQKSKYSKKIHGNINSVHLFQSSNAFFS